jgi:tetratricopeptide (TPR) repeat protein
MGVPAGAHSRSSFERVKSTYSVKEISRQFGLSEHHIRRWTREGLVQTVEGLREGELRYDFRALTRFRQVRELRNRGLSLRQIEAELRGQLNLFPGKDGQLIQLPARQSPFEEALSLHECGDPRAPDSYRQAIRDDDFATDAYCNLGILEFEKCNLVEAFDCFTKALRNDPRHFESHLNLAHLYFECGDLRLARLHYELAAAIEPGFADLYFNLGLVHAVKGDFEQAVNVLERARELSQEDEGRKVDELLSNIARVLRRATGAPEP